MSCYNPYALDCPWCHTKPFLEKTEMWSGTHGYHGCYDFSVKCKNPNCKMKPSTPSFNTIYQSEEEAIAKANNVWNERN